MAAALRMCLMRCPAPAGGRLLVRMASVGAWERGPPEKRGRGIRRPGRSRIGRQDADGAAIAAPESDVEGRGSRRADGGSGGGLLGPSRRADGGSGGGLLGPSRHAPSSEGDARRFLRNELAEVRQERATLGGEWTPKGAATYDGPPPRQRAAEPRRAVPRAPAVTAAPVDASRQPAANRGARSSSPPPTAAPTARRTTPSPVAADPPAPAAVARRSPRASSPSPGNATAAPRPPREPRSAAPAVPLSTPPVPLADPDAGSTIGVAGVAARAARVVLKGGKSKLFREGHPLVFTGAIDRIEGHRPVSGAAVMVADGTRAPIGWGIYNSTSMYAVRLLQLERGARLHPHLVLDPDALLSTRLAAAVSLRVALGLPNVATTAYRVINSEGDGLSGLIVDIYDTVAVASPSAAWVAARRLAIESSLIASGVCTRVVWRPAVEMLALEGVSPDGTPLPTRVGDAAIAAAESADAAEAEAEAEAAAAADPSTTVADADAVAFTAVTAPSEPPLSVLENGVAYQVAAQAGQKTGFYCDQRDNRAAVRLLASTSGVGGGPGRVADLCCYSGGFAINAALGGAASVVGVDTSVSALALASTNASLNGVESAIAWVRADVEVWLREQTTAGAVYDLIILDPPKLAPTKGGLARAVPKYLRLNRFAMGLLRPGGLLLTCTCSGAMTQSGDFPGLLREAAAAAGRRLTLLRVSGPAGDHVRDPAFPEGNYFTSVLASVG